MSAVALERMALADLLVHHDHVDQEPRLPFAAFRDEIPVIITAILERTAAYHTVGDKYDTGVIRLERVFVDPDSIEWVTKKASAHAGRPGAHFRTYKSTAPSPEAQREISDRRALADQARGVETMRVRAISKQRREELKAQGLQHCSHCNQDKPIADFQSNGYCRPCGLEYSRRNYAAKAGNVKKAPIKSVPKSQPAKAKVIPAESKKSAVLATSPAGDHYKAFPIEPIEYIERNQLGFHEANVVKYVTRWKLKAGVEDLKKARFYIDRLIELQETLGA
jgi:hypothetical protein